MARASTVGEAVRMMREGAREIHMCTLCTRSQSQGVVLACVGNDALHEARSIGGRTRTAGNGPTGMVARLQK